MANTYTWTFPTLDRVASEGGKSDVVKRVHWVIQAVSDSDKDSKGAWLQAKIYGATPIVAESGVAFTAYNSITKDWCKARVLSALGEIKAKLDARITEQKTPTVLTGTPSGW
jgi:hypothetical protein